MLQLIEGSADHGLAQYGVLGAVFAAVFAGMTIPMLRNLIAQNGQVIELLRRAVETNTTAVATFQRIEDEIREQRAESRADADAVKKSLADQAILLGRVAEQTRK